MKLKKQIAYLGANLDFGQPRKGTSDAYGWLKLKGLNALLEKQFLQVHDLGEVKQNLNTQDDEFFNKYFKFSAHHFPSICEFNKRLALHVEQAMKEHDFVLNIGGDHSMAMGSISGALKNNPNTKVIWIDAHADFNGPVTSPSGNVHGMPLSFLTENFQSDITSEYLNWIEKLNPENIVLIGLRDLDKNEPKILEELNIRYYTAEQVKELGIEQVMNESLHYLSPDSGSPIHLSFDVDGIDPKYIPSTGTAVSNGLSLEDGEYIISTCYRSGFLKSMDLVEINPHLGNEADLLTTANSVFSLLESFPQELTLQSPQVSTHQTI